MRDFIETCAAVVVGIAALLAASALMVLTLAIPFIAIGVGLGFIGWTFCLFVSFC